MASRSRPQLHAEARRTNAEQLARLGAEVQRSRQARWWTQEQLGSRAGVSRGTISRIERGLGGNLSIEAWQRVCLAIGRPLRLDILATLPRSQRMPATLPSRSCCSG